MGAEKQHLKIVFRAEGMNSNDRVEGVWWHQGALADNLQSVSSLDVCYAPEFNHFRGERKIQFMICDIKPPE